MTEHKLCPMCNGIGVEYYSVIDDTNDLEQERDCYWCGGRGLVLLDEHGNPIKKENKNLQRCIKIDNAFITKTLQKYEEMFKKYKRKNEL